MKITAQREALADALAVIHATVPTRTTIPMLNHVLVEQDGEALTLTATSMEMQTSATVPAFAPAKGAICLPADILHAAVKNFSKGATVTIESSDAGRASLTSGRSRLTLNAMGTDEFPLMEDASDAIVTRLDASVLHKMLASVVYAASDSIARPQLQGVFLHTDRGSLTAVACDGTRVARMTAEVASADPRMPAIIIPTQTVKNILSVMPDDDMIELSVSSSQIAVTSPQGICIRSRLIGMEYPDYRRMIAKHMGGTDMPPVSLSLYPESLTSALDRAFVIYGPLDKAKWMVISSGDQDLKIKATSDSNGVCYEEADATHMGEAFTAEIDPAFLRDVAKHWPHVGDEIRMHYVHGTYGPIAFTSAKYPGYFAMLMLRVPR